MREQVAVGQNGRRGRLLLAGTQIALKIYEKSRKSLGAAQMGPQHVAPLSFELHAARFRSELVRCLEANKHMTTMKHGGR